MSQWWEDHFPINNDATSVSGGYQLWFGARGLLRGQKYQPVFLGYTAYLMPRTDPFPFHYQKPLSRPLAHKDVWFQFHSIIASAKDATFTPN